MLYQPYSYIRLTSIVTIKVFTSVSFIFEPRENWKTVELTLILIYARFDNRV